MSNVVCVWKNVALMQYSYARMEVRMETVNIKINGISIDAPRAPLF